MSRSHTEILTEMRDELAKEVGFCAREGEDELADHLRAQYHALDAALAALQKMQAWDALYEKFDAAGAWLRMWRGDDVAHEMKCLLAAARSSTETRR